MQDFLVVLTRVMELIRPILEIGLLAVLIYNLLYFLRGTRGARVLAGIIVVLIILTILSDSLQFEVLNWLLNNLWAIIPVALVVIFQPEFRRAFAQLGTTPFSSRKQRKIEALNEVVQAVINMSKRNIGALIVFERQIGMRAIVNDAIRIDGKLSRHLVESIFYPNSALHDGAVIIKENVLVAAHAILPLSQDESLVRTLGTRHRAAIGITEETDAVALIVSEETGTISIACQGRIRRDVRGDKLQRFLTRLLVSDDRDEGLKGIFGSMAETTGEETEGFKGGASNG